MKVTFVKHSSFLVELENRCLLFDYFDGEVPETTKPVYAFASHSHSDHFSEKLFGLKNDVKLYFLSSDIPQSRVPEEEKEKVLFVNPCRTYRADGISFATLRSTDMGVAYLIECEGRLIYHAGDLNCWVWDGAPKFRNDRMVCLYKHELEALNGKAIDLAFVPLDPRQETDFDLGMRYFFEAAKAKYVFPMHMWGDFSAVPLFKSTPGYEEYSKHLMDLKKEGQTFEFS